MPRPSSTPLVTADLIGRPEFERFCEQVFAPLPRRDQKHKASAYVAGLLRAGGRKSLRNIASAAGSDVNEQSLHHFVSESTWPWRSVRKALARHLSVDRTAHALVVQPWETPAAGRPDVEPVGGRPQAFGLWAATDRAVLPLSWWRSPDAARVVGADFRVARRREVALVEAYLDAAPASGTPVPLVVDARGLSVGAVLRRLGPQVPTALRIAADQELVVTEPAWADGRESSVQAQQVAWRSRNLRRPTAVSDDAGGETVTLVLSSLRVQVPEARSAGSPLAADLVCIGEPRRPWPQQLWLMAGPQPDVELLLYLASLLDHARTAPDLTSLALGLHDYRGRSDDGFHRHATLVGVAQAYLAVHGRAGQVSLQSVVREPNVEVPVVATDPPRPRRDLCQSTVRRTARRSG
ncbi:transposase [Cellulomonas sp. Leaf334]|uniref:transposase n=1 Tax=Cellulomonas sp. Leaf334 TaxID=1736339 RepID=UPI000701FB19|nr:transposase [Cellulomonas sp. Leaf334]KQR17348.1 hypothetical protein ASF78_08680 [Cellulomonas sp. Leaf334]